MASTAHHGSGAFPTYSLSFRPDKKETWRLVVKVEASAQLQAGTSAVKTLRVR